MQWATIAASETNMKRGIDRSRAAHHLTESKLLPIAAHRIQEREAVLILERLSDHHLGRCYVEKVPRQIVANLLLTGRLDLDQHDPVILGGDVAVVIQVDL